MPPSNSLILKGRMFDGLSLRERAVLKFDASRGRITGFGDRGEVEVPREAKVIEAEDATVLPGLIDSHVHFFGATGEGVGDWATTPETLAALRSVSDLRRLVHAGFTTVRELGTKGGIFLSKAAQEGAFPSPAIISCGRAIAQTGGDDDPPSLPLDIAQILASYTYFCDGPWECRKAVRRVAREGARVVKFYASGAFSRGVAVRLNFTTEEMAAIVDESHRAGLRVAAHAYGEEAILNAVESGADSIEHGLGLTKEIALSMNQRGTYYVPTIVTYAKTGSYPSRAQEELVKMHLSDDLLLAKEQGVKVAMGSDIVGDVARPHGRNYEEIVAEGSFLGNESALASATSIAASCLDLPDVGRLGQGFVADILVVRGNPLDDLEALAPERVLHVFKRGKPI